MTFIAPLLQNLVAGQTVSWPIDPALPLWLASPCSIVNNLLHCALLPNSVWGHQRHITLPGITTTSHTLIDTVSQLMGRDLQPLVHYTLEASLNAIIQDQPSHIELAPAVALGCQGDRSLTELLTDFLQ